MKQSSEDRVENQEIGWECHKKGACWGLQVGEAERDLPSSPFPPPAPIGGPFPVTRPERSLSSSFFPG